MDSYKMIKTQLIRKRHRQLELTLEVHPPSQYLIRPTRIVEIKDYNEKLFISYILKHSKAF